MEGDRSKESETKAIFKKYLTDVVQFGGASNFRKLRLIGELD
jgi:hypothetical protein